MMSTIQNTKRKLKRKAKKFKLKAVMKNRFVLEGFYSTGIPTKVVSEECFTSPLCIYQANSEVFREQSREYMKEKNIQ